MDLSQYHHYIPRFILRNFTHQASSQIPHARGKAQKKRRNTNGKIELLWIIDLVDGPPWVIEKPLAKVFGEQDLYRDFTQAVDQHRLEKQLSDLESKAGQIISKIKKDFEAGRKVVSMDRATKDVLRKFLFIMKYRGPTQFQRYRHESIDSYHSNDKAALHKYMKQKGFERPIDVWFSNMKTILDLKLDPDNKWVSQISSKMYPGDAIWFSIHFKYFYLAICTPSDPNDEFLLSANLFGVHEGPISWQFHQDTEAEQLKAYTEYHILNVIHPRLVLVLRSTVLPSLDEDSNPMIAQVKKALLDATKSGHHDPLNANSMLTDLPVTRASNSYSEVTAIGIIPRQGHDTTFRSTDVFNFKYFPVSGTHVEKINAIILENGYGGPIITCKSIAAFQNSLEAYLSMRPVENDCNTLGLKMVRHGTAGYDYMKKLVCIARQLGSKVKPMYHILPSNMEDDSILRALGESFEVNVSEPATEFESLYARLGGTLRQFPKDVDQARRILAWRVKLDVYTRGLPEDQRVEIREKLRDLILQLPVARVWLYVKTARMRDLEGERSESSDGSEDVIVRFKDAFRASRLCYIIYFCAIAHTWQVKNPSQRIRPLIAGSIKDCGILAIERRAIVAMDAGLPQLMACRISVSTIELEHKIEIMLRFLLRQDFHEIMRQAGFDRHGLDELEHVLFDILYCCPGST